MANTKYILEMIKIEGEMKELLVKSTGENVAVTYNGVGRRIAEERNGRIKSREKRGETAQTKREQNRGEGRAK